MRKQGWKRMAAVMAAMMLMTGCANSGTTAATAAATAAAEETAAETDARAADGEEDTSEEMAAVPEGALVIARQGMFSSGGTVTEPVEGEFDETTNWLDLTRAGNTAHVDHANVLYQIPANGNGNPIVYLHGYGQSRMGWMTTPDGREGWSDIFLKNGHSAFLVDQPRRGEAGSTAAMTADNIDTWSEDSKEYMPGDQAWYTHFRIGRVAPERYEGSQFPEGEEAQNQFFRQMTPNTGSYDEAVDAAALGEVMNDVYEMTGDKAIYITHSQGGRVGWSTPMEHVSAIVAIEPGGTPEIGSETYQKLLDAEIPIVIYFGDYIDNGPQDIQSTGFWKEVKDAAFEFAEAYNADGGDCTVVDLPKEGITGNSHFMFQEMNNQEIAEHIESWLAERGLN
ncbi:UNVERIFIED_ORG: alpha/beta hydrolase [Lacrimispora saccharolytica]